MYEYAIFLLVCSSDQHHQRKDICISMVLVCYSHGYDDMQFHLVSWTCLYSESKEKNRKEKIMDKVSISNHY